MERAVGDGAARSGVPREAAEGATEGAAGSAEAAQAHSSASAGAGNGTGAARGKILIADDDRFVKKLLELILAREGYEVLTAADGSEAIYLAERHAPGLIILDIEMPGLDGYETCRELSSGEKTRDIPVIFLSSRREVSAKIAGLELGAVDYVAKPFEPREFLARVRSSLRTRTISQRVGAVAPGERDRRLARKLRHALNATPSPDLPGLEVGIAVAEGALPNGEFFELLERQGKLLVAFGTVRGEDLPAAAAAHALQQFLRSCVPADDFDDPPAVAAAVEHFFRRCCREELGLALTLVGWPGGAATTPGAPAALDPGLALRVGGAGGCSPLHRRLGAGGSGSTSLRLIPGGGRPIDADTPEPAAGAEASTVTLGPGESLLLYSEELAEGELAEGELARERGYDLDRLAQLLGRLPRALTASALARAIASDVETSADRAARTPAGRLQGDITLVVIRRTLPDEDPARSAAAGADTRKQARP